MNVRSGHPPLTKSRSASQSQLGDETSISLHILSAQIVEEATTLANHHQQATPAVVIVLVLTEMLGQMIDPLGEQGDLDFRRAGVTVVGPVLGDYLGGCLHYALNLN